MTPTNSATGGSEGAGPLAALVLGRADSMSCEDRERYFAMLGLTDAYRGGAVARRFLGFAGPYNGWRERVERRLDSLSARQSEQLSIADARFRETGLAAVHQAALPSLEVGKVLNDLVVEVEAVQANARSKDRSDAQAGHRVAAFHRTSFGIMLIAALWAATALLPTVLGPGSSAPRVIFHMVGARESAIDLSVDSAGKWDLYLSSDATEFTSLSKRDPEETALDFCPVQEPAMAFKPWQDCGWRGFGLDEAGGESVIALPDVYEAGAGRRSGLVEYTFTAPGSRADLSGVTPNPTSVQETSGQIIYTWHNPTFPPELVYASPSGKRDAQGTATLLTLALGFLLAGIFQVVPDLIRRTATSAATVRVSVNGVIASVALAMPYLEAVGLLDWLPIDRHTAQMLIAAALPVLGSLWLVAARLSHSIRPSATTTRSVPPTITRPSRRRMRQSPSVRASLLTAVAGLVAAAGAGTAALVEAAPLPLEAWVFTLPIAPLLSCLAVAHQAARLVLLTYAVQMLRPYLRPRLAIAVAAAATAMAEHGSLAPVGMLVGGHVETHQPSILLTAGLAVALAATAFTWQRWRKFGMTALLWGLLALALATAFTWQHAR